MRQSITSKFTPTQRDYEAVLRLYFWHHASTRISIVTLVIAFGFVIYLVLSKDAPPSIFEVIWLLLPPFFVWFILYIQPARIARQAALNDQLITEATWEVSESGIQISSQFGSTIMEWGTLEKLLATRDYYLVLSKTRKNAFRFLPRRAFTSREDENEFLELINRYLPKN